MDNQNLGFLSSNRMDRIQTGGIVQRVVRPNGIKRTDVTRIKNVDWRTKITPGYNRMIYSRLPEANLDTPPVKKELNERVIYNRVQNAITYVRPKAIRDKYGTKRVK